MRKRTIAAVAAAVLVAVAAATTFFGGRYASSRGPVQFLAGTEETSTTGIHSDAGDLVVFGGNVARNSGAAAAVLTSAELVGDVPDSGAKLIEVRALDPTRSDNELIAAAPWPYEDYAARSVPLEGYHLQAGADVELLFVVQVVAYGSWHWPTTAVTYTSGGTGYRSTTGAGFQICAPRSWDCL